MAAAMASKRNPNLWDAFLGRFNDIDSEVRMLCIHMLPQLLSKNQELPHDQLLACFQQRIYDPDEGVRLLALQTMTALTKKSQSEFSDNFFELLKERSRDKTLSVRKEACFALSSLYKDGLESKCLSTAKSSSALNTILHLYYQNSLDDKFIVERLLKSSIVPYTSTSSARVQALIRCYSLMDEASIKAMQEIFKAQYANLNLLRDTVKLLEKHMGGEISPEANTKIMSMIQNLNCLIPKTEKSVEHLKRFFNQTHTDKDLRKLLVKLTKPQYTCEQVVDTLKEILRKIGKTTGAVNNTSDNQTNYSRVVKMLLERCAPVLFDKEFGKELMSQLMVDNQSSSSTSGTTESISVARSLRLLLAISVYFKEILPPGEVINYLLSILSDTNYSENGGAVDEIKSTSVNSDCDPSTLQEIALNILCCILGRGTSGSFYTPESNDAIQNAAVQQSLINCAHLSRCSQELLPILRHFCCTGITVSALESSQDKNVSKNSTKTNRGYGVKKLSPGPTTEEIAQMGLVWRRERRRSKLSVRVLFCLLDVVHQLMCPLVDLDSEDDKLVKKKSPDNRMKLISLESTIKETLNEIVKVCISCPVLSSEYIACLTSLNHIALLFPGTYNDEIKTLITKSLVQQVLPCEPGDSPNGEEEDKNHAKLTVLPKYSKPGDNLSTWCPDGLISDLTKAKISAIKLMTNWLVGLKNEVKPVAQAIIRLIYRIIIHDGDLTKGGKLPYGEMSRMRLVAATSWLKLARCQAYVECIEIGWYLSMTYILCDPCPQIRSHFLTKLNQGLYKLRLPLEYMAIFAHASNVPEPAFKQRAKQLFIANVQRRRAFLNKNPSYFHDTKYLFGLLPDYILPYVIYLLSHDSKWTKIDDVEILNKIKSSLWFVMEPIMSHGDNFSFLRKIIEKIKYARDALNPDDAFVNEKLYTVCDICLGLLLSRCTNPTSKEYPVDVKLPKTLFTPTPIDFRNPDFKQLMNMVVESGTQENEDTLNESMEAIVKNKTKPILQFTPNKHTKEFKDGLIPPELLKMKNAAIPKTKKTKAASKNEESKAKFETKSKKDNNEPSRQEENGPVADTVTDDDQETDKEANTIHCIASTSRVSPKSTIVNVIDTDINVCIVETHSTRSSSNPNKRKNAAPPGIVKRQRVNPSPNSTSNLHQSTLDRVVQTNKTSQKDVSSTANSVNQQVSSISPRKSPKHFTKPAPEAHSKKSSKPPQLSTNSCSNNSKNTKQESNLRATLASNDRVTSLRSKSIKSSEKTQGLTDVSKKSLQNANKTPPKTNYRVSKPLRTNDNSNGSNNISERPSRLSAIVAKQKLLSPMSVFSSTSTSNQSTPKGR
ncbi:unnamed protein product [Trichobilharzia szidati]|nr:unnamed protein product [Trichobilharzia szidati]